MAKIQFDYNSIKDRIMKILSSESEWSDFLDYGAIDNVISAIANEMAYEIQYAEYNTMENFWNMARNRSSLLQMSPMHGYIVPRKQASTGTLIVSTSSTFDSSHNTDIIIPKFFQFSGNNIYVCAKEDAFLSAESNTTLVKCIQGEYHKLNYQALGIQYEEITIIDDSIDNSFFTLTVNDVEWEYVDSLFLYNSDDNVYEIKTLPDLSGITIRFGNGIFGKRLNKDDIIVFKYISTLGEEGNIYSKDIINTVESQAFDINGNAVKLYCANDNKFIGGVDYPSLEYIRELSPKVYQTGDRASSTDDYYTIIKKRNDISKVIVWGAYETLKDKHEDPWSFIPEEENRVHIAVLNSEYENIDNNKKKEIIDDIHDLCDPTDLINFEDAVKIPMIFYIKANIINSSYTTAEVRTSIEQSLSKNYDISNMNFGESIYNSDYVRLIDEVKGVDNHITYIKLFYEDSLIKQGEFYVTKENFELPIHPINSESVEIYVKFIEDDKERYEKVAVCDNNGNIIGVDSYITTNSKINLQTGDGYLRIKGLPPLSEPNDNYVFKILYQYTEENLKVLKRQDILYYADSVIELYYD